MKTNYLLSFFILLMGLNISCTGQTQEKETAYLASEDNNVAVYYFHFSRRCVSCKIVEKESKKAVKELYGDKVMFKAYNLESDAGEEKAKEVGAAGQSLLIVNGDKKINNITSEGFMYARRNPEKFKQIIKDNIDPLIN